MAVGEGAGVEVQGGGRGVGRQQRSTGGREMS